MDVVPLKGSDTFLLVKGSETHTARVALQTFPAGRKNCCPDRVFFLNLFISQETDHMRDASDRQLPYFSAHDQPGLSTKFVDVLF